MSRNWKRRTENGQTDGGMHIAKFTENLMLFKTTRFL